MQIVLRILRRDLVLFRWALQPIASAFRREREEEIKHIEEKAMQTQRQRLELYSLKAGNTCNQQKLEDSKDQFSLRAIRGSTAYRHLDYELLAPRTVRQ